MGTGPPRFNCTCITHLLMPAARALEADAPSELRRLFHAAEQGDVGVRIRPRRGSACVFWTRHPGEPPGDIDPRTWHGAEKLVEGAGGKMIAQKFKEVPLEQRGDY